MQICGDVIKQKFVIVVEKGDTFIINFEIWSDNILFSFVIQILYFIWCFEMGIRDVFVQL